MKITVAVHGTRGDVEPCTAVALELARRGHEVRMAVPPNLVEFVRSAGLHPVVAYGPDSSDRALSWSFESVAQWRAARAEAAGRPADAAKITRWWRMNNPVVALGNLRAYLMDGWADMSRALDALSTGCDLILTGMTYQEVATNVAESRGIPLAALHYCPIRPSSQTLPVRLPAPLRNLILGVADYGFWRLFKPAEDAQRRELGLPRASEPASGRMADSGALELQAYDRVFYPALAREWGGQRPLIGSLTVRRPAEADRAVLAWIEAGTAPIYFGLGSMVVQDPAAFVSMITDVCTQLDVRGLICAPALDSGAAMSHPDRILIVSSVNHSVVFPLCRAIVHHGGSGTTHAAARSGVPSVLLWIGADQPAWAKRVAELGIGEGRRLSSTTRDDLLRMLRTVLTPRYAQRAREVATQMTDPADSVRAAATLLEQAAVAARNRNRTAH